MTAARWGPLSLHWTIEFSWSQEERATRTERHSEPNLTGSGINNSQAISVIAEFWQCRQNKKGIREFCCIKFCVSSQDLIHPNYASLFLQSLHSQDTPTYHLPQRAFSHLTHLTTTAHASSHYALQPKANPVSESHCRRMGGRKPKTTLGNAPTSCCWVCCRYTKDVNPLKVRRGNISKADVSVWLYISKEREKEKFQHHGDAFKGSAMSSACIHRFIFFTYEITVHTLCWLLCLIKDFIAHIQICYILFGGFRFF